jgi:hypothetical protein
MLAKLQAQGMNKGDGGEGASIITHSLTHSAIHPPAKDVAYWV